MAITEILPGIHYVGVNDRTTTRFEALWSLPMGVSYNAYLVAGEKIALIDTVEESFGSRLEANIREAIGERKIDYLVVNHMEPDHSSSIAALRRRPVRPSGSTIPTWANNGTTSTPATSRSIRRSRREPMSTATRLGSSARATRALSSRSWTTACSGTIPTWPPTCGPTPPS